MDQENNSPQETTEIEEKKDTNWIEVTVNLFKMILEYKQFEYGVEKDF